MLRNYMNYAGSKDRYYPLIREFLEKAVQGIKDPKLVDMFCGSAIVSFNSLDMFSEITCCDGCEELINIHKWIYHNPKAVQQIREIIAKYGLSKDNKEGFLKLRDDYNTHVDSGLPTSPVDLYCLVTHSFNYSLHLNKKGQFNAPSGAGRSYFSPVLERKLKAIQDACISIDAANLTFVQRGIDSWEEVLKDTDLSKTVFFVDPPYSASISKHPYRVGELRWKEEEDRKLFNTLDLINSKGGKFILTNVFKNNGVENIPLQTWANQYKVHHVGVDYTNCNYQRLNRGDTDEVIVYNF